MVAEERFLKSYKIHALQAVGWEGVWGLALLCTGLAVVYQVPYGPDRCGGVGPWGGGAGARDCLENTWAAVGEIGGNGVLFAALVGNLVSISMFNFCGISVTKALSATHRTVGGALTGCCFPVQGGTRIINLRLYSNRISCRSSSEKNIDYSIYLGYFKPM
mmetsp:Transcript_39629/g.105508  ORF Transcript_39629/g.105508 Transcript_39629/m.105508 type:complete len:161 (-) Transcript_39629:714-1196(-)